MREIRGNGVCPRRAASKYASPPVNGSGLNRATRKRAIRALAGVCLAGGALFGWMWTLVGDGATDLDRQAFAAVATHRGSFLARAAEQLATIGPLLTGALVVVVIAWLARRRRWLAATGIVGGYLLVALAAHLVKAAEQRPRPAGAIIYAGGYSFPSTESALAVGLIAMAVVGASLTKHRARRLGVIGAAGLLTGVIGTVLVSIRVHYLTDVLAGWAMGATVFAACGLGALTIESHHGRIKTLR